MRTISVHCLQPGAAAADHLCMNSIACSAVARAGLVAATASLDSEGEWPLLQVAGWLTTAADVMLEAGQLEAALTLI
jgi:hypothetical protein